MISSKLDLGTLSFKPGVHISFLHCSSPWILYLYGDWLKEPKDLWASASSFDAFNSFFPGSQTDLSEHFGKWAQLSLPIQKEAGMGKPSTPVRASNGWPREPACTSPGLQSLVSSPLWTTHFHLWLHHAVRPGDTFPAHRVTSLLTSSSSARSLFKGDHPSHCPRRHLKTA